MGRINIWRIDETHTHIFRVYYAKYFRHNVSGATILNLMRSQLSAIKTITGVRWKRCQHNLSGSEYIYVG